MHGDGELRSQNTVQIAQIISTRVARRMQQQFAFIGMYYGYPASTQLGNRARHRLLITGYRLGTKNNGIPLADRQMSMSVSP